MNQRVSACLSVISPKAIFQPMPSRLGLKLCSSWLCNYKALHSKDKHCCRCLCNLCNQAFRHNSWIDKNHSTNSISEIKGVHIDYLSAADVTLDKPELRS